VRDEQLKAVISRVDAQNYGVYGAWEAWLAPNREGMAVDRCTVEQLMRDLGLAGARRGSDSGRPGRGPARGPGPPPGQWCVG
jgi:putative transposase